MLVHEHLIHNTLKYARKSVLVCGGDRISYEELDYRTNQLGHALRKVGVRRGDRVALYLPNSIDAAIAVYAILKAGAVFVPVNPGVKADKLSYILRDCGASVVIADAWGTGIILHQLDSLPALTAIFQTDRAQQGSNRIPVISFNRVFRFEHSLPVDTAMLDKDLACLIYTSGSTGKPKGVVCGHDNVDFACGSIVTYLENTDEDIIINALPFSFDYGLYQLLMTVCFGGTLVIENAFAYPVAILKTIERERVTGLPLVPTLASMLLRQDFAGFDLTSLRYVTSTGAALPPAHIKHLEARLPHVRIYSMYGMTECKRTLYLPPERLADRPTSVGMAIPGTEVWLEDENGRQVGRGASGELVVRGSHVMRGYWKDDELTARYYLAGPTPGERVLHSGDLFRMDEEGLLYFLARKDDIIKSAGEKVAPKEVESVISELKGVAEVAVVGMPDEILGQAVTAYVVAVDPAITEQIVQRHCARRLESFMTPQTVHLVEELPRSSNGKVKRRGTRVLTGRDGSGPAHTRHSTRSVAQ